MAGFPGLGLKEIVASTSCLSFRMLLLLPKRHSVRKHMRCPSWKPSRSSTRQRQPPDVWANDLKMTPAPRCGANQPSPHAAETRCPYTLLPKLLLFEVTESSNSRSHLLGSHRWQNNLSGIWVEDTFVGPRAQKTPVVRSLMPAAGRLWWRSGWDSNCENVNHQHTRELCVGPQCMPRKQHGVWDRERQEMKLQCTKPGS